jgi:hypothetical protein
LPSIFPSALGKICAAVVSAKHERRCEQCKAENQIDRRHKSRSNLFTTPSERLLPYGEVNFIALASTPIFTENFYPVYACLPLAGSPGQECRQNLIGQFRIQRPFRKQGAGNGKRGVADFGIVQRVHVEPR